MEGTSIIAHMENMKFHRLFSQTMYKNRKLLLGEMTFTKDFIRDDRGDLYPVIHKSMDCAEEIENNQYRINAGTVKRMFGVFFPYATYEIDFLLSEGFCGFSFFIPNGKADITYDGEKVVFQTAEKKEYVEYSSVCKRVTMMVSCRPGAFDIYFLRSGQARYFYTFQAKEFQHSHLQKNFQQGYVCLSVCGKATVHAASFYIDCGISQADIRPIRYENGEILFENGKVYLTASIRMQEEMFQGIFAWMPSTAEIELCGALFYDSGDGYWCGDVAASVLYHREKKQWYLWVCSFAHGHVLGHSVLSGDPRFGVNVADIILMEKANVPNDITRFSGFEGDEDPDFYYNEKEKKWYMAICRIDPSVQNYRYVFFKSDKPFTDYEYIGKGYDGAETGGSFVTIGEEKVFVCGNDFHQKSNYRIYTENGMREADFDFPDGGYRGWGTIIPVEMGSRRRYFWITFDRHNGSSYLWSYGNIYCFEGIL